MSAMVDRVAGFLRDEDEIQISDRYRRLARTALAAMREPTQQMLVAASKIPGGGFQNSHSDLEVWQAMIDEALK